jgi:hypothetical protein
MHIKRNIVTVLASKANLACAAKMSNGKWKYLLATHSIVFIGGVVMGKGIHADELESYRSVYRELPESRIRRFLIKAGVAVAGVAVVYFGLRSAFSRSQLKNTEVVVVIAPDTDGRSRTK